MGSVKNSLKVGDFSLKDMAILDQKEKIIICGFTN